MVCEMSKAGMGEKRQAGDNKNPEELTSQTDKVVGFAAGNRRIFPRAVNELQSHADAVIVLDLISFRELTSIVLGR